MNKLLCLSIEKRNMLVYHSPCQANTYSTGSHVFVKMIQLITIIVPLFKKKELTLKGFISVTEVDFIVFTCLTI